MSSDDLPRLIYLIILGGAVLSWFIAGNRQSMSKTMQQAIVWLLIFVGVVAGIGLFQEIRDDHKTQISTDGETVTLTRQSDGHFYATAEVNGMPIDFLVDTGATDIVLTLQDAEKLGFAREDLHFLGSAQTANGSVKTARIRLDSVQLETHEARDIRAFVNEGALSISLLGMEYLEGFSRIEIAGNRMILSP
ncbi:MULTISPECIES: TIGR02281 family clan AA aspartic protease [Halocynthiibacter]|uniref:TIGR02281 family clan AA aspartic protease n=1 Tax=Halocynthiibacter halioticoli TaxID=2986804 RepID=A0AAE3LQM3_9RHOB|nr:MULTISPECIES: TIGR02281 family clan AA aspartic protease [Halocynthiibacter]MCV6824607.1 TIGR02281 family clan AA aspartic protease [Halocynthiibacter halioticoli]MCW4057608.1 TIGR02281 family clan AA aspartic protease [Halocynthiibacter sp. SDUM655004]